jgi:hypothetical protein
VLNKNKDLIESIAQALLDRETLDRTQLEVLERGEELPPLPVESVEEEESLPLTKPAAEPEKAKPGLALPGGEGPLPGPAPGVVEGLGSEEL